MEGRQIVDIPGDIVISREIEAHKRDGIRRQRGNDGVNLIRAEVMNKTRYRPMT